MSAAMRPRRRIVASAECVDALGGKARLIEAWDSAPDALLDPADAESADFSAHDECLLIFDQRLQLQQALDLQRRLLARGTSIFFVGVEPGMVQIGPVVRPGVVACLECWKQRVRTNHRSARHLSDADAAQRRARPYRPLSPISSRSVIALIAAAAAAQRGDGDAALLPTGVYYRVNVDCMEVLRHRFIGVTHCPGCSGEDTLAPKPESLRLQPRIKRDAKDKRVANERLSLRSARRVFVDRHSGLIKHVFQNRNSDLMPLFTAERPFVGGKDTEYSHGRASNYQTSELVALLEGIERYAGNQRRSAGRARRGSYAHMAATFGDRVLDPAMFILHSEKQRANPLFLLEHYSEDLEYGWTWGHSMRRQEPVLVPEQLAYFQLPRRPGIPINRFVSDSSNGCSLGGSLEEAMLGGLHEVVERDAYFSTWYTRIAPLRIAPESIADRRSAALIARAQASGFEVHLFDITSDTRIPTVWAMIVDPAADATVKSYCASACDGRWSEAIFSALAEVTTSMGVYRKSMEVSHERARAMYEDDSLVQEMYDHVLLYSLPETYERLEFLLRGGTCSLDECRQRTPDTLEIDLTRELTAHCNKVLEVCSDIVVVDQTFPELEELGLCAAKVMAPGLLPVTFGHQYQRIDMDRLNRFARFRGVADADFSTATVNPYPHNFP
jgi:ribosomal protein S12 methylthiotransferase accessory factor